MNQDMNARLLRGALATVRKALKVRGMTDVDELTLYSPLCHDSPGDPGTEGVDDVENVARDDADPSVHGEPGIDTATHAAVAEPQAHPAPVREPRQDVDVDQTAEELFAEMPWEPGEEPRTPVQADGANDGGGGADRTLEVDAAGFLNDMPWDGARTEEEKASMSEHSGDDRTIEEQQSNRRDDAQDFFENLNWDGDDEQGGQPEANTDTDDTDEAGSEGRFSVDSDGAAVPDHVRRVVELRERDRLPEATDDALDRSAGSEERRSEGGKE